MSPAAIPSYKKSNPSNLFLGLRLAPETMDLTQPPSAVSHHPPCLSHAMLTPAGQRHTRTTTTTTTPSHLGNQLPCLVAAYAEQPLMSSCQSLWMAIQLPRIIISGQSPERVDIKQATKMQEIIN